MRRVWFPTKLKEQAGFLLVEVLLAIAIFGLLSTVVAGTLTYGTTTTQDSGNRARAMTLADEGLQAVRNIKDAGYTNLVNGTYGLTQTNGTSATWTLSGSSDTTGIFTRQVVVSSGGTNRENVAVTVSWPRINGTTASVTANSEFSNWTAATKSWANAIKAGNVNAGSTAGVKVATSGNYAYIVDNGATSNFIIVNISNPAAPTVVSTSSFVASMTNVAVSGNYAYVTTNNVSKILLVINISNPAAPTVVGTLSTVGTAQGDAVFVSGNYAYLTRNTDTTTGSYEFNVVNISNPAAPSLVGGYDNDHDMRDIWGSGNYMYVANSSTTTPMLVINVSTPTAPTLVTTFNPASSLAGNSISGFGSTVLIGTASTLTTVNVATPSAPAKLGSTTGASTLNSIAVDITNQYAFLGTASATSGFQIVNIASLTAPAILKTITTTTSVSGVSYDTSTDTVAAAGTGTTLELQTYTRN